MQKLLFILLSFGIGWQAQAEIVPVLAVHSDYFPDRDYALGLDLDSNALISRIYFQDENGHKAFFSLDDLQNYTPIFKMKGFALVRMKISSMESPKAATVELQMVKNYLTGSKRSVFFKVTFSADTHQYEITDSRSDKIITSVLVETRYASRIPVGIYDLVTE
ncbi:MAG: hypothetical protein H7333_04640 [Bdellovibrionales bacterium]|nr:hypothetical protein [Oligoflexia bacterium]